ncbi:MAG: M28 family peptidase [Balneolales bacterium]|nr:M28 family peptidase [Balneolales bacterium]
MDISRLHVKIQPRFVAIIATLLLFFIPATNTGILYSQEIDNSGSVVAESDALPDNSILFEFRNLITEDLLKYHLETLASDEFMGRGTGQQGILLAAEYLASYLEQYGVQPLGDDDSYFQHFELNANRLERIEYTLSRDNEPVWSATKSSGNPTSLFNVFAGETNLSGDIVFAGLGIESPDLNINHYSSVNIRGNWALIFRNAATVDTTDTVMEELIQQRLTQILFRNGARGVLLIDHFDIESYREDAKKMNRLVGKPSGIRLPDRGGRSGFATAVKSISPDLAVRLLELNNIDELHELHQNISTNLEGFSGIATPYSLNSEAHVVESVLNERNVLGFIEGCHPELKNEVVVLSAHYDHMGIGTPDASGDMIYNGADDNGSGTVTTLSIAKAVQMAKNEGHCLDRSLLFLFVSAEEHGLLGSRYYSDNPVIPIENTVANFNLDMFGQIDYEYEDTDKEYIYIIGAEIISSDLNRYLHRANDKTENLILDMRYNDLDDRNQFYRRSDHWNFGRLGVPFIFFFSGLHDHYHQPSDTIDRIPYPLLEKRARLIFATLAEVANAEKRPVVDNEEFINRTRQ